MFLILSLLLPVTVLASGVASAETKLAATIFSYDGADFVRTRIPQLKTDNPPSTQSLTTIARPRSCVSPYL